VRRCAWIVALASLIVLVPATASNAGGWDSLHFPRDHYVIGDVASTTQLFYAAHLRGAGELDAGPYYAYLLPLGRKNSMGLGMIDPPDVPTGAIRVGTVDVSGPFHREGYKGPYGRASLTFTVPDVPTGRYSIGFCDDPCRHGYIGWLAWASITIVHTRAEGRMLAALDERSLQLMRLRDGLRHAEGIQDKLEGRIATLGADLRERTMALRVAGTRVANARPEPTSGMPLMTWWEAILLAMALLAAAIVVRRRRRPEVDVPDSVPDGLLERESTGV
jgi:hypothetical protein